MTNVGRSTPATIATTATGMAPRLAQPQLDASTTADVDSPSGAMPPLKLREGRAAGAQQAVEGAAGGGLVIPDWVKDAVFYQVFTDRFENGDMGNDPQGTVPWGSKPTIEQMQGGDLDGVAKRMGYLTELGVNALYFNPIFEAPSNHKYNTASYERIAPDFGGRPAYDRMVESAKSHGMKIILDGVFNHVSHQHDWFKDVRENGPKSKYWDRFSVRNWPITYKRDKEGVLRSDDYESWWGYATLPVLKTDDPEVRDYFLTGKDAIIKKWVREGKIDGWRMDVADDSNFSADYWRTARKELKSVNPDAYMVAENWKDASAMLQGDQFDGAMNYQYFTWPSVDFFAKKSVTADDFVNRLKNGYSREAKHGMFNILDSHDTERFITQAGGDWYRQRPAAIFQMTYIGAPVVYYGDEIGMDGGKDPDNRRGMEWQYVDGSLRRAEPALHNGADVTRQERADQLFALYQKLIATRKAEPALRRGDFSVVATHNTNQTLVYRRKVEGNDRDAIVAINNNVVNKDITVPLAGIADDGTRFTDALSGHTYEVHGGEIKLLNVDGNYGAVLLRDV
ncbi:MAG: glycoside hydrolase family 13 protein [Thermoleophilia bacterium]|nr:glycoside hydrolase family 13 protein [Thermoleophilia bacterium]